VRYHQGTERLHHERTPLPALPQVAKTRPYFARHHLAQHVSTWLNMFPHPDSILAILSPRTIVTGNTTKYTTHCRVPISAYYEVHNKLSPSNTKTPRTSGATAINATGNLQGNYQFLALSTRKQITR